MCVITERILGRISFKNFGFISSKLVALDLMLKIDLRTSHWLTQLKLKTRKNAIVEYLDYQIPVNQLNGDMHSAKRDRNSPPTGGRQI